MSTSLQVAHLATGEFWLFLVLAAGAAIAGFYYGFHLLRRARLIEDTPTARVRSAQQGYVELVGAAQPFDGQPLAAPLTGVDCCWFSYKIERRGNKNWHTVEKRASEQLFLLRDETGDCVIDPEGASVTGGDRSSWYGSSRHPPGYRHDTVRPQRQGWQRWSEVLNRDIGFGGRYRYTEIRIYSGDPLYALGHFKSLDELDHSASRRENARALLREWKQDQAALLARFDRNGDGRIDLDEWEAARRAAAAEAATIQRAESSGQHLHTLSNGGPAGQPFLLSTRPEFNLVRRLHWQAGAALLLFFAGGAVALWLLGQRLAA